MSELRHEPTDTPTLSLRRRVPIGELMAFQGEALAAVWAELEKVAGEQSGHPYVRYWDMGADEVDVEVGIPLAAPTAHPSDLAGSLPGGTHVVVRHDGAHDALGAAYARLAEATGAHEPAGPPWEVYEWIPLHVEPNPATWAPPAQWSTLLVQPVTAAAVDR